VWTPTELIKALWIFRNVSPKEPHVWWTAQALIVFGAPAPKDLDEDSRWSLTELRWVYVEGGNSLGESHWMLTSVGGR
jgi:hypothetical protein